MTTPPSSADDTFNGPVKESTASNLPPTSRNTRTEVPILTYSSQTTKSHDNAPGAITTAQLLKMAQAAHGQMVQIPANLLTSLLTSMNMKQDDMKLMRASIGNTTQQRNSLQRKVESLNGDIQTLRFRSGVFTLFGQLPIEIRNKIWTAFWELPTLIALKRRQPLHIGSALAGPHTSLFTVCYEARSVLQQIQKQSRRGNGAFDPAALFLPESQNATIDSRPHLFNGHSSIVWLLNDFNRADPGLRHMYNTRMAISYDYLASFAWDRLRAVVFVSDLVQYQECKELFIVVGNESAACFSDRVFINPTGTPYSFQKDHIMLGGKRSLQLQSYKAEGRWNGIESSFSDWFEEHKEVFIRGLTADLDLNVPDPEVSRYIAMLQGAKVPTIKFVEVARMGDANSSTWVQ